MTFGTTLVTSQKTKRQANKTKTAVCIAETNDSYCIFLYGTIT